MSPLNDPISFNNFEGLFHSHSPLSTSQGFQGFCGLVPWTLSEGRNEGSTSVAQEGGVSLNHVRSLIPRWEFEFHPGLRVKLHSIEFVLMGKGEGKAGGLLRSTFGMAALK